jgi:hypothetical protein
MTACATLLARRSPSVPENRHFRSRSNARAGADGVCALRGHFQLDGEADRGGPMGLKTPPIFVAPCFCENWGRRFQQPSRVDWVTTLAANGETMGLARRLDCTLTLADHVGARSNIGAGYVSPHCVESMAKRLVLQLFRRLMKRRYPRDTPEPLRLCPSTAAGCFKHETTVQRASRAGASLAFERAHSL